MIIKALRLLLLSAIYALYLVPTNASAEGLFLKITNSKKEAVAGAHVLIGTAPDNPFRGNLLVTDQEGRIPLPEAWQEPLPVTVTSAGYISTTFLNTSAQSAHFVIQRSDLPASIEVSGQTQTFPGVTSDGLVDFGLVIPALKQDSLVHFDISDVVSAQTDTISVMGQSFELPANLTLPNQTENYIFPITLNKPTYRMTLKEPGSYRMVGTHGRFPLKKVVDALRGGQSVFDVVNDFEFIGGGEKVIHVQGNQTGQNIAMNQNQFRGSLPVKAPSFSPDRVVLALALVEREGLLQPTDVKRLSSLQSRNLKTSGGQETKHLLYALLPNNKTRLKALEEGEPIGLQSFEVLKSQEYSFNQMSLTFVPASSTNSEFISPVAAPILAADRKSITLDRPAAIATASEQASYLIVSKLLSRGKFKIRQREWEAYAPGWLDRVDLSHLSFTPGVEYQIEVLYLASSQNDAFREGFDLSKVSHVSRNALTFQ